MRAFLLICAVILALPLLILGGLALGPVAGVLVLLGAFAAPLLLLGGWALR